MKNLCTVSDINYLYKGLTLYESLNQTSENFILHYLCIDDKTYEKIKKYQSENLIAYKVDDLLNQDENLKNLKKSEYKYFCWSLASYFSFFLLRKNFESITYIDSDIFFNKNIDLIFDEIGNKEVGIFRHRQFDLRLPRPEGWFNVGVVYFKNGKIGNHICKWWSESVLHKKYPNLSTCGDQKYLDEFPNMCPDDYIFIDGNIGHGAPWHWQLYDFSDYEKNGNIIWNGNLQKLVFTHFSQFEYNNNGYIPSKMHHIYTPLNYYSEIKELKLIYDEYYKQIKYTLEKYI